MLLVGVLLISGRPTGAFQGSMTLFLSLFLLISMALLVVGIFLYNKRLKWVSHSKTTYGKIVEISKRYARGDHSGRFPIYFPIVAYQVNGLEFRREAEQGIPDRRVQHPDGQARPLLTPCPRFGGVCATDSPRWAHPRSHGKAAAKRPCGNRGKGR